MDRLTRFVDQRRDDFASLHVEDFAGRGISSRAINTKTDPARLVTCFHTFNESRSIGLKLKNVKPLVESIADPELFAVGSHADTVTRTTMTLHRATLESVDLDSFNQFSALQIPDFEPQ